MIRLQETQNVSAVSVSDTKQETDHKQGEIFVKNTTLIHGDVRETVKIEYEKE